MKRINLTNGTATVSENIGSKTINALNKMSELVFKNANKKNEFQTTHTEIMFLVKDEPILSMIQKQFDGRMYTICVAKNGKYTRVLLNVDTLVEFFDDDIIMLDGYETQFENLKYY